MAGSHGFTSRLIGRQRELQRLVAALRSNAHLVTLFAWPGQGKSLLAREALALGAVRHRVRAIDIPAEGVETPSELLAALAQGLSSVGPTADLVAWSKQVAVVLKGLGPTWLLLDGFERASPDALRLVSELAREVKETTFLLTSRRIPDLAEQTVMELPPLGRSAAAQLFVEYATAGGATRLNVRDAHIGAIVEALDGNPLAIKLAAARASVLRPVELRAALSNRFALLHSQAVDSPVRHASLALALSETISGLNARERRLLSECCVFVGGFDPAAANAVLSSRSVREDLAALHRRGLLTLVAGDDSLRFFTYNTLREFVRSFEQASADRTAAEERHTRYYGAACDEIVRDDRRREASAWVLRERQNLLALLERNPEPEPAVAAGVALTKWWIPCGSVDDRLVIANRTLEIATGTRAPLARALGARAAIRGHTGAYRAATADMRRALTLSRKNPELSDALTLTLAAIHIANLQLARAESSLLRVRKRSKKPLELATADSYLALLECERNGIEHGAPLLRKSIARYRVIGAKHHEAVGLVNLGVFLVNDGAYTAGVASLERARRLAGELDVTALASLDSSLGEAFRELGEFERARRHLFSAIEREQAQERTPFLAAARLELGLLHHAQSELTAAADEYDEAFALVQRCDHGEGGSSLRSDYHFQRGILSLELCDWKEGEAEISAALAAAPRTPHNPQAARARLGFVLCRLVRGEKQRARKLLVELKTPRDPRTRDFAVAVTFLAGETRNAAKPLPQPSSYRRITSRLMAGMKPDADRESSADLALFLDDRTAVVARRRIDLSRRRAAWRILLRLAEAHAERPGTPIPARDLTLAGWPGERVLPGAAKNRLHFTVSELRRLGLRDLLLSSSDGYELRRNLSVSIRDALANA